MPTPLPKLPKNTLRLPGKTVFILGSGFSRPLGVPVIADFIPEGLALLKASAWEASFDLDTLEEDAIRRRAHQIYQDERQIEGRAAEHWERAACEIRGNRSDRAADRILLEQMKTLLDTYARRIAQLEGGSANLEDLFCLVDLFEENEDRKTLRRFISRVCARAWKFHERDERQVCAKLKPRVASNTPAVQIKHYFRDKTASGSDLHSPTYDGSYDVCLYEAFLSQVLYGPHAELRNPELEGRPDYAENAIISLNYDLVIEREAKRFPGVRIFYGEDVLDKNAKVSRDEDGNEVIVPTRPDLNALPKLRCLPLIKLHGSLNWKDPDDERSIRDCGMTEREDAPLILPTWQRNPIGKGAAATLLSETVNHLRRASKLVFIGYSMPATDRYLRYLFSDALATSELPEIEICNLRWSETDARDACLRMLGARAVKCLKKVYSDGLKEYVCASITPDTL